MHPYKQIDNPVRLKEHLPLFAAFVLNPWAAAFVLLCLAGIASFYSIHYGLGLVISIIPFYSYYLERNLLDRVLLPPFSIIAFWRCLGSGLGVCLLVFANHGEFDKNLLKVQIATMLFLGVGWWFYRLGFGRIPKMHFPELRGVFQRDVTRPLVWCGWFFLLFFVIGTVVKAASGNLDRGESSIAALGVAGQANFGVWTIFNIFTRFNNFGFFLTPLIWRYSPLLARFLLIAVLLIYMLMALLSGSRGSFIYPIVYIGVGIYFFRSLRHVKLDILAIVCLLFIIPLVLFVDAYRNTDAYMATRTTDIAGRVAALGDAFERLEQRGIEAGSREKFRVLGASAVRSFRCIYISSN